MSSLYIYADDAAEHIVIQRNGKVPVGVLIGTAAALLGVVFLRNPKKYGYLAGHLSSALLSLAKRHGTDVSECW